MTARSRKRSMTVLLAAVALALFMAQTTTAFAAAKVGFMPLQTFPFAVNGPGHTAMAVDLFHAADATPVPDVLVPNGGANSLSLFTGAGDGTFSSSTTITSSALNFGGASADIAAGDVETTSSALNYPDALVTNFGDDSVAVLISDGAGGFSAATPATVPVDVGPTAIAAGDLTGDGILDFVTANEAAHSLSVRLGNGNGTFSAPATASSEVTLPGGSGPTDVVIGFFNNDNFADLAVAAQGADSVYVFFGNGAGGFTNSPGSPYLIYAGAGPFSLAMGDFDGNGSDDLMTTNLLSASDSRALTVMINNGSGGFGTHLDQASGNADHSAPLAIAAKPLQIQPDPVNPYYDAFTPSTALNALLNSQAGDAVFSIDSTPAGALNPVTAATLADVNQDGMFDLISAADGDLGVILSDNLPPVTTATSGVTDWNTSWVATDVPVSLDATDPAHFGIASTLYKLNAGGLTAYPGSPVTISTEGTNTFSYFSTSVSGLQETTNVATVRIDKTAPTVAVSGIPATTPPASFGWTNANVVFSLAATDTLSGLASRTFQLDAAGVTTYVQPVIVSRFIQGVHTLRYWATDNAGTRSDTQTATFGIDIVTPSTAATTSGIAGTGWANAASGPAYVGLHITNPDGRAPTATYYRIGSGARTEFTTAFPVMSEGVNVVSYQSTDAAGNIETTKTLNVQVDTIAPTSTISGIPTAAVPAPIQFTLAATDATPGSGVATRSYRIDGGSTQTYTSPVTVSAAGTHTVEYWATDVAGNVETTKSATFEVTPPLATTTILGVPGGWSRTPVTFTIDATGYAPLTSVYALDAGGFTTYTAPVGVSTQGTTTVTAYTRDGYGGGRDGATVTATIRIDSAPPTTTSDIVGQYSGPATITLSATDALSGVAATRYRLDGGSVTTYTVPFDVSAVGTHTAEFFSVDVAGNVEETHTATFAVRATDTVVAGPDRYATAVAASRNAFASANTVVIATGGDFPDALSAAALAGAYDGPVLLTHTDALPSDVASEIARLGATDAFVVGGTGAVNTSVFNLLEAQLGQGHVTRIAGANRYATAAHVADHVVAKEPSDGTVFVATGLDYPDALAAGPASWVRSRPVLLVNGGSVPEDTKSAISRLGATRAVILGGTGVVPANAATIVQGRLSGPKTLVRLAGTNRYGTASAVASWSTTEGLSFNAVGMATGEAFADALGGGPAMGRIGSPLLLTRPTALPAETSAVLGTNKGSIAAVTFFGGDGAVPPAVRAQVMNALK